jgi:tRNA threonylcarbamoyladenosine biosynthesis protein TsaE
MTNFISHSLEETQKIASDFVSKLPYDGSVSVATVVGLYGDLGAGKTTFTQAIARVLRISDTVTSPTFVIMKVYELNSRSHEPEVRPLDLDAQGLTSGIRSGVLSNFTHFIHIDAYRMDSSDELAHLGWQEIISNPRNLILVEWPERVADIMPEHIKIHLKSEVNPNEKEIAIMV